MLFHSYVDGKTDAEIKMLMENDGNGTCYGKENYQNVISEHENKYVLQIKPGGSATNVTPIKDCVELVSEAGNYQELRNKGGFSAKITAAKCNAGNITSAYAFLVIILVVVSSIVS